MDNFDLKKYLAEGKLLKEIKVNDPAELRKHGPRMRSGGTPYPLDDELLTDFLALALSGMDEGEIDEQVYRDEYEDDEEFEAFDYVYNSLKNNKLTKFTTEQDGWVHYYQLSIYDSQESPGIRIILNVEKE